MDGQLIVVHYNNRKNAFEGARDKHTILNIENKLDIAPMIQAQLKLVKDGGYVLIKYAGIVYICERDNVDATKPYRKHAITYHPLMSKFTI